MQKYLQPPVFGLPLLWVLILLNFSLVLAQSQDITLRAGETHVEPALRFSILEDKTASLSIEDILRNASQFTPSPQEVANFGASKSALWLRLIVTNRSREAWFLSIDAPFLKEVDMYKVGVAGVVQHVSLGSGKPFKERIVQTTEMIFPLGLQYKENAVFYFRIRSNSVLKAPFKIATLQYILENTQTIELIDGIYFGLILALIIYNLFVFISIRESAYLYYAMYILCIAFNIAYIRGYLLHYIFPAFPQANHSVFSAVGAFLFAVLFTNSFLNTRHYCPELRRLGYFLLGCCVVSLAFAVNGDVLMAFQLNWIIFVFFIYYFNRLGFSVLRKGFSPARYYLLGFNIFFAALALFILKDNALLPQNMLTESAYQIGSALESVILSYALANKLHIFKRERQESQDLALLQANQFSQQLIASQEIERKRVAAELHDSLGQSLGMVKNKVLILKRDLRIPGAQEKQVADLETMVTETIQEVRNISYNLRPLHLELLGVSQSIQSLLEDIVESSHMEIESDIKKIDGLLTKENEINVFRIIQECLNNIVKHAQATRARVRIISDTTFIYIRVEDNGIGIASKNVIGKGCGLISIRERLNIMNGQFEILQNIPNGTIVSIKIKI
ncbi:histidine kinase [Dyadobacter chenwenxiniae]|uniref:Histidine kinase n=1 Tax=Dyadobacter chenwenxiniae TaxID=2906456 RepID=A0A9X1PNI0_9BACT|nr:7TM diverse intracellular signaling domain-containing protein [Dyadobacter chenwenxiniae]MCF0062808.1 histidine kinase [Dyadobacter chenwenxiniae]UON85017.1 histidine kinase [Dyadobacter chenwenxiniae]